MIFSILANHRASLRDSMAPSVHLSCAVCGRGMTASTSVEGATVPSSGVGAEWTGRLMDRPEGTLSD